jgi:Na+-transporting methylmalonyl-CoA/oxaloacetate decarboxylase gamma subunit
MKEFQSRVVAAWVVALPIAYALVADSHHRISHLRSDPQGEVARQLQSSVHTSFVGFFLLTFGFLVLVSVVIDWLGNLIQRLFPEPEQRMKAAEPTSPVA